MSSEAGDRQRWHCGGTSLPPRWASHWSQPSSLSVQRGSQGPSVHPAPTETVVVGSPGTRWYNRNRVGTGPGTLETLKKS